MKKHRCHAESLFPPAITRLLEIGCMGAVFMLYVLLKGQSVGLRSGDGGLWFYVAKLWADGVIPYRDFFVSHPPLQFVIPAILYRMGLDLYSLNALHAIATGAFSGFFLWRILARAWGFTAAFLGTVLFLFGETQLVQSDHFTGASVAVVFLLWGADLLFREKHFFAGVLLGIGTMVTLYLLPVCIILVLGFLLFRPKELRACLTGFSLVIVLTHLPFLLLSGRAFIGEVYLYHLAKVPNSPVFQSTATIILNFLGQERSSLLLSLLSANILLFSLLPGSPLRLRHQPIPLLLISLLIMGDDIALLTFSHRTFMHYLVAILPFAAIGSTYAFVTLLALCTQMKKWWKLPCGVFLVLGIVSFFAWYLLSSIAPYGRYSATTRFTGATEIALYVKERLAPEETVYGDFGLAPIVAMLSGRRIAGNEVESSIMRFEGKFSSFDETLKAIEVDHIGVVLLREGLDLWLFRPFREYLEKYYDREKVFPTTDGTRDVELWRRKRDKIFPVGE